MQLKRCGLGPWLVRHGVKLKLRWIAQNYQVLGLGIASLGAPIPENTQNF